MSDLIDRQLVLDRINKQREHLRPYLYPQDKIGDSAYRICAEFVERIPSTESQRKKGKWIRTRTMTHDGELYCDQCEQEHPEQKIIWNFCPNCGADMRGGDA